MISLLLNSQASGLRGELQVPKKAFVISMIAILQLFTIELFAQRDSCWTVLLLGKGNKLEIKQDMGAFSKTGFYLYRNCVYEIETKNSVSYSGRLIDIKPDTLFFTNLFNVNVAGKAGVGLDTIALHYRQLDKLRLIADRSMGIYNKHSFDNFDFIFKKDTSHCSLSSDWMQIFANDLTYYEVVPHLTAQGINLLFEEGGRTYYFYGAGMIKPDRSKMDDTYDTRNFFWGTPCKVEKINGVAIGVFTENIKNDRYNEKDSLKINGLNLEINPFAVFTLMNPHFTGPYPDSIEFYNEYLKEDTEITINGVNVSLINTINETKLNGANITGLITLVDEISGFSLSGISSFAYKLNGVSIAGIYNRATIAKGLQIGLINKSASLKGIQVGLWNTNGKRSLPIINWQFKN